MKCAYFHSGGDILDLDGERLDRDQLRQLGLTLIRRKLNAKRAGEVEKFHFYHRLLKDLSEAQKQAQQWARASGRL